ncbi:MAG TPA: hypothetical protein DCQ33_16085 [Nitrospira sp.]|nr:hypothetical protein [Nitrospira sp.]
MSEKILWTTDPFVVRTIADDSFGGWENALVEAIKNSVDATASRIDIDLPTKEILIPYAEQQVVVQDNGWGMTIEDLKQRYCRFGKPKHGHRGTGKIATFVVADRVRVETWSDGQRLELEFPTSDILDVRTGTQPESDIQVSEQPGSSSGTRLTLLGFKQDTLPPSVQQVHHVLLRHFQHLKDKTFYVNSSRFIGEEHASAIHRIEEVNLEGVGRLTGEVFLSKQKLEHPGLVVYSGGQSIYGPELFGIGRKGYKGDSAKIISRLPGRIEFQPDDPAPLQGGAWTLTSQFKAVETWVGELLDEVVDRQIASSADDRLNRWLEDATSRRYYERLGEDQKAAAKRILRERAKRAGDSNPSAERIIARLLLRSLSLNALTAVLDVLELSSDEEIEGFGELFRGQDRWTLRQVARAASLVKQHLKAIDDLEACVADYSKNESAIHQILAENAWIISDDFHSFRSNRQIKTTLKTLFNIDTDEMASLRRPDFFFVLGDAASNSLDQESRYLFVELKGPDQPLSSAHQNQVVRDAKNFQKSRPGFAYTVLLGTEFSQTDAPDKEADSKGFYSFRALTYERLIERARFRLLYMLEGVNATGAEDLARRVVEQQLEQLVDGNPPRKANSGKQAGSAKEPFRRLQGKDVRPFENAVPLYDLRLAAGPFSPERMVDEVPEEGGFNIDDYTWVAPQRRRKLGRGLFVAQVFGQSMNRKIPDGAFCLFRANPAGDLEGRVIIAQHRSIQDADCGHLTVKIFEGVRKQTKDGVSGYQRVVLKPDSDDASIAPIVLENLAEGELRIIGEFVEVLTSSKRRRGASESKTAEATAGLASEVPPSAEESAEPGEVEAQDAD